MNYRTAPEPVAPSSVRFAPWDWGTLWLLALALGGALLAMVVLGLRSLATIELRCAHETSACVIETRWPAFTRSQSVSLRTVEGTVLMGDAKHGYTLALTTVDPATRVATNVSLPNSADEPLDVRKAQKATLDEFLGDPSHAPIDLPYSSSSPVAAVAYFVSSLLPAWGLCFLRNGGRLEIDWQTRRATIVRERWPLPPRRVSAALADLVSVRAEEIANKKGPGSSWNVQLELADGSSERLAALAGTSERRARDAVAAIRALLARRDES